MGKILCPYHDDTKPSMEIYPSGWGHCFVCNAHVKVGETDEALFKKEPEKVEDVLKYIRTLPKLQVRCLEFHADSQGFYIIWPTKDFYKKRNFFGNQRYAGPKGVRPPLFKYPGSKNHIVAIEGELNAISVYESVVSNFTICSPGSATNFSKFINEFIKYDKITLVLDYDASGIVYGLETKEKLLKLRKHCKFVLVTTDYNDILQQSGPKLLAEKLGKDICEPNLSTRS